MSKFEDMPQLVEHEMNQCRVNQYEYFREQHEQNLKEIEEKKKVIEEQKERIESLEEELEEQYKTKNEQSQIDEILVQSQSTTIEDLKDKLAEKEMKIDELTKLVINQRTIIGKQKELGEAIAAQANSIIELVPEGSLDDTVIQSSSATSNPFLSACSEDATVFDDIFWRDANQDRVDTNAKENTKATIHSKQCKSVKGKKKKIPYHESGFEEDDDDDYIRRNGNAVRATTIPDYNEYYPPITTIHFQRGSPSQGIPSAGVSSSSNFVSISPFSNASSTNSRHKKDFHKGNRIIISEEYEEERYEPNPCNQQ